MTNDINFPLIPKIDPTNFIADGNETYVNITVLLSNLVNSLKKIDIENISEDEQQIVVKIISGILRCRKALKENNPEKLGFYAYMLGSDATKLNSGFHGDMAAQYFEALLFKKKNEINIYKLNMPSAILKELADEMAESIWKKFPSKRIGEVSELVWSMLFTVIESIEDPIDKSSTNKAFPDNALHIKNWIRHIAPPEASRRGRPRK